MAKAQHTAAYQRLQALLREMREEAGLTQRAMGKKIGKPQSWVFNCETGNRRMDITEFIGWCRACGCDPRDGFAKILKCI
jgi:DNA-binding XRE family transcriptional regulator